MPENIKLFNLKTIKITGFSLYAAVPQVIVDFDKPVTCLAGANGLGKSTFLNIITYALTGIVKKPNYNFKGFSDIRKANYAREYFEGRIRTDDSQIAEVELTLQIGNDLISIKRNFKNGGELISWCLNREPDQLVEKDYENKITQLTNLKTFEQFIFLVQYVLLFDESRETVFWNISVLTNAINLLLGLDSENASKLDELNRTIDKFDSDYRNTQWQITKIRNYILELEKDKNLLSSSQIDQIVKKYNELVTELDETKDGASEIYKKLNSINSILSELSAKKYHLQKLYDYEYSNIFNGTSGIEKIKNNSIIKDIFESQICPICNEKHIDINIILDAIEEVKCPLCNSTIVEKEDVNLEQLKQLDLELGKLSRELSNLYTDKETNETLLHEYEKLCEEKKLQISEIETLPVFQKYRSQNIDNTSVELIIKQNYENINVLSIKLEEYKSKRDTAKEEARILRDKISEKLSLIQGDFIPIFKNLASKFLGLDVSLRFDETDKHHRAEYKFVLEIGNTDRVYNHQLSESQRFFLDIALRMALIIFVGRQNPGGILLLDTPEGSLDIAYETNAGTMLAEYSIQEKQLILTANVNSSGLLSQLAKQCGSYSFRLIRMIYWAQLSNVQLNNLSLIEQALNYIENI